MLKQTLTILCLALATLTAQAVKDVDYDTYFTANTLRVDYQLCGDATSQHIVLDGLSATPGWAGRRHNLDRLPILGNGQLQMRDKATGRVIYSTSFSSLFLEWLATDEAKTVTRAFEHSVLVPMPQHPVEITTTLINASLQTTATFTHTVDPTDILIEKKLRDPSLDYQYLHKGGSVDRCIDVAILAEGYDRTERDSFLTDAHAAMDALFSHEPFKSHKQHFNIVAVFTPSEQSGMSVPRLGQWRQTAFGSHFSTFYSDRYLTTTHIKQMHNAISGVLYEHIIILANTDEYGGGGIYNDYTLTTAHHRQFHPVVVHEFGHSFGGLADEYQYGDADTYDLSVEPWEQNITSLRQFDKKWKDMVGKGVAVPTPDTDANRNATGAFEGAGYNEHGMYRPTHDCRMRTNAAPAFCPVCQRALTRLIDFYTK